MSDAAETLHLAREGAVALLTIDRPDKRNALDSAILAAWPIRLDEIAADQSLRVLVVTGAGSDFSAGADIDELRDLAGDGAAIERFCTLFAAAQAAMAHFPKPAIAMISGPCVGGGCGLALGCDLRLADPTARFGITPAALGLDYSLADTKRLVDAVGLAHAADLLFSSRLVGAEEALAMGLVNRVIGTDRLGAETRVVADRMASRSASSQRAIKAHLQAIRAGQTDDDAGTRQAFAAAFRQPDFAEGLAAFLEKRPARFR